MSKDQTVGGAPHEEVPTLEGDQVLVQIPTPLPAPNTIVKVEGIQLTDPEGVKGFVRIGFASPFWGVFYVHVPAVNAEAFCGMLIAEAKKVRSPLIVPDVKPSGPLRGA
jgi:hypothetical protein